MKSRVKASLIHLSLSVMVVVAVLAFIYFVSFPYPFFDAMGTGEVLYIIAAVDVVLGPAMTLIIFNPAKKSLKADLAIIAFIQLAALSYGFHTAFSARPVYAVFYQDRFHLISALQVPKAELNATGRFMLPINGPEFTAVDWPEEKEKTRSLIQQTTSTGTSLLQLIRYYQPLAAYEKPLKKQWLPVQTLIDGQPKRKIATANNLVQSALAGRNIKMSDVFFIPLQGKGQDMSVLIDGRDLSIIAVLPIHPWAQPEDA